MLVTKVCSLVLQADSARCLFRMTLGMKGYLPLFVHFPFGETGQRPTLAVNPANVPAAIRLYDVNRDVYWNGITR